MVVSIGDLALLADGDIAGYVQRRSIFHRDGADRDVQIPADGHDAVVLESHPARPTAVQEGVDDLAQRDVSVNRPCPVIHDEIGEVFIANDKILGDGPVGPTRKKVRRHRRNKPAGIVVEPDTRRCR